jgi:radical SAM superfamily enzyme YgiQ (UPF0313 family)/glycosyltransferase involved in cell wall biosynthesis
MYDKAKVKKYFQKKEFKKGLSYLENFLRKEPDNPELLNDYGVLFSFAYNFYLGRHYLHKAIEIKNDYKEAIINLTEFYLQHNLPFSAIKVLTNSDISKYDDLMQKLETITKTYKAEKVTFYIPVYNVEKYIESCIKNILKQTYPIYELLIIDDASPDNSILIAEQYYNLYPSLIKIIKHEKNKGLASVRNTALLNAKGDFLATVDTDAVPEDIFLESIMMEFNKKQNKSIAGIGGKLLESNSIYVVDRWRDIHMKQHWDKEVSKPPFLYGSTSVYRIEPLHKVGGFNDEYKTNYEDCDISFKLKNKGYTILYTPDARARHLRKDTLKSVIDTYYNWVAAPYRKEFNNFKTLEQKAIYAYNILCNYFNDDIKFKRFHILYPTFLSYIYWPLKDIQESTIDNNTKTDTLYGLLGIIFYSINKTYTFTEKLKNFLYKDLENFLSIENFQSRIRSIATIPSENPAEISQIIIKNFPGANIEYISKIGSHFIKLLNFEPIIYRMLEISRERIAYEEKYENNYAYKKPKIMLLNLPWRDGKRYGIRAGSRWPFTVKVPEKNWPIPPSYIPYPFFLGYATAVLKQHNFNAIFIDAIAEGLLDEEFFERIRGFRPDIILIETATASIYNDINYVRQLKSILPHCKIIMSGTHVSYFKEQFLKDYPCVDGIIIGEIEEAFLEIVKYFTKNKQFDGIQLKGFIYYNQHGEITGISERTDLIDIDKLPYPERLTLPIYNYEDLFAGMIFPSLQIHASRGCPFGCIYCVWPQVLYQSKQYRTRDPIKVVAEIKEMIDLYGYKSFYFDDDTFNIGKERILKICNEIIKTGLHKLPWAAMARADTSDFETLKAMRDAGLISIKFGVESATQELVDACGKGLDLQKVEQAVQWCRELGLQYHLTFTFGLPGETKDTIEKTIQYAIKLAPNTCQFSLTTPFPGTKYFDMAREKGLLLTQEWDKYDGNRYTVMKGENLSAKELEEAVEEAYRRWSLFDRKRKEASCQCNHNTYCNKSSYKVIFICQDGYQLAPARVRCYNFAKELNKHGISTDVLSYYDTLGASHQGSQCNNMDDIEKLELNLKAYEILEKEKDAIFYVQKAGYHFLAPYLVAQKYGNKIIFDYDDYDLQCHPFQNLHQFVTGMRANNLFKDLAATSNACIGASKFLCQMLGQYNQNVHYIVTGVDTDKFDFQRDHKAITDFVEILWLGDIWSPTILNSILFCIKNYIQLNQAIITKSRLNLITFGTFAPELENIIKTHYKDYYNTKICFHSQKHPDEIPEILYRTHIGLAPLSTDNEFEINFNKSKSPTKVFEYMACKVAVLGTKIGELGNIIEDGYDGFLFDNDPREFQEKLSRLIMSDTLRNTFALNAYKKVTEKYSLKAIGQQLITVINSILNQ